jgi:hypothetical protein
MPGSLQAHLGQVAHQQQLLSHKRSSVPTMAAGHALIAMQPRQVDILMLKSFAPRVYQSKLKKYANSSLGLHGHHQWVDGELSSWKMQID